MKKFVPLALALMIILALAVPAFAAGTPAARTVPASAAGTPAPRAVPASAASTPAPLAVPASDAEDVDGPNFYTESKTVSTTGRWESVRFTATPGNGCYIRFWFNNTTAEAVKVYLYRFDSQGDGQIAKSMEVPANSQKSEVYSGPGVDSCTYKIVVEAYVSGGDIDGSVDVAQYLTNPAS